MDLRTAVRANLAPDIAAGAFPGVVLALASPGGLTYRDGLGPLRLGAAQPMTPDAIFWLASMTKPITATAALQQVERGALALDAPASDVLPELGRVQVLQGFDAQGQPRLRAPVRPITLRALLTHTSGYAYEFWNPDIARYQAATGTPRISSGRSAALRVPLVFDPGERWEYGMGVDWAGQLVEASAGCRLDRYLRENLLEPLGMRDTDFVVPPDRRERMAGVHRRGPDGAIQAIDLAPREDPEFCEGGGGLYGTAADYLAFCRMILRGGELDGERVLTAESAALLMQPQPFPTAVPPLHAALPRFTCDVDLLPGLAKRWSLALLVNAEPTLAGRSAGSGTWGGLANTWFWIDPRAQIAAVFLCQLLPFCDPAALELAAVFERTVYRSLPIGPQDERHA